MIYTPKAQFWGVFGCIFETYIIKILLFMLIHMASSIYRHYDIIVNIIGGKLC